WAALQTVMQLPPPAVEQVMLFQKAREWIDAYLRGCATRLLDAAEEPPREHVAKAIAQAFGFSFDLGRGSPLSDGHKRLRDRRLALEVLRQLQFERYKETLAVGYVARKNGLSQSVVGEAWRDFKRATIG